MSSRDKDAARLTGADYKAHCAFLAEEARRGKKPSSVIDEPITMMRADSSWAGWYTDEATRLRALALDLVPALEHIGSTSVPGLDAKPFIDIMAGIADPHQSGAAIDQLHMLGYESLGEAGVPGRWAFRYRSHVRSFNISVVAWNGERWRANLNIRDYLRRNPAAAQQYATAKWTVYHEGASTLFAYSDAKRAAIERVARSASNLAVK